MRITTFSFIAAIFMLASMTPFVFAADAPAATAPAPSYQDLGVAQPRLLPSSPFYFLKDWGRNIRLFFIFDPVKKATQELQDTTMRAAEAKAVAEQSPDNVQAIAKALANYTASRNDLIKRLQTLQSNPNAAELIQKVTEQSKIHSELFMGLQQKFESTPAIKEQADKINNDIKTRIPEAAPSSNSSENTTKTSAIESTDPHCIKAKDLSIAAGQALTSGNSALYQQYITTIQQESLLCAQILFQKGSSVPVPVVPQSETSKSAPAASAPPTTNTPAVATPPTTGAPMLTSPHCVKAAELIKKINSGSGSQSDAIAYGSEYGLCIQGK